MFSFEFNEIGMLSIRLRHFSALSDDLEISVNLSAIV